MATILGFLTNADGTPYTGEITITPRSTPYILRDETIVGPVDTWNITGSFTSSLLTGQYAIETETNDKPMLINVPDSSDEIQVNDIIANCNRFTLPSVGLTGTYVITGSCTISIVNGLVTSIIV